MGWADRQYDKESPRVRNNPTATFWLVGVVLGAHLLRVILERMEVIPARAGFGLLGVSGDGLRSGKLWQPITALFIHGSVGHLLIACLLILVIGRIAELLWGGPRAWLVFLLCGAVGYCFAVIPGHPQDVSSFGALAGAVGVVVALMYLAPQVEVDLFLFGIRMIWFGGIIVAGVMLRIFSASRLNDAGQDPWWALLGATAAATAYALLIPRIKRPAVAVPRKKAPSRNAPAEPSPKDREAKELDRILEKISQVGLEGLTPSERAFLDRTSERLSGDR